MKSQEIPMTREEFEVMPWRLGWKHEYFDGTAFLTPRNQSVATVVEVKRRILIPLPYHLRSVAPEDAQKLKELYFNVFRDSVEFCNQHEERIQNSATRCIDQFLNVKEDKFSSLSQVAVSQDGSSLLGIALVIEAKTNCPFLRLLCVAQSFQRQGIGTSMVTTILNKLARKNVTQLKSRYFLANEMSRNWHHRFGFQDHPDLFVTRLYFKHFQHELLRQEKLGQVTEDEQSRLASIVHEWEELLEKQEAAWKREFLEKKEPQ